jgi:hypothetical protein
MNNHSSETRRRVEKVKIKNYAVTDGKQRPGLQLKNQNEEDSERINGASPEPSDMI